MLQPHSDSVVGNGIGLDLSPNSMQAEVTTVSQLLENLPDFVISDRRDECVFHVVWLPLQLRSSTSNRVEDGVSAVTPKVDELTCMPVPKDAMGSHWDEPADGGDTMTMSDPLRFATSAC